MEHHGREHCDLENLRLRIDGAHGESPPIERRDERNGPDDLGNTCRRHRHPEHRRRSLKGLAERHDGDGNGAERNRCAVEVPHKPSRSDRQLSPEPLLHRSARRLKHHRSQRHQNPHFVSHPERYFPNNETTTYLPTAQPTLPPHDIPPLRAHVSRLRVRTGRPTPICARRRPNLRVETSDLRTGRRTHVSP